MIQLVVELMISQERDTRLLWVSHPPHTLTQKVFLVMFLQTYLNQKVIGTFFVLVDEWRMFGNEIIKMDFISSMISGLEKRRKKSEKKERNAVGAD